MDDEQKRKQLQTALSVISGRTAVDTISAWDLECLGYELDYGGWRPSSEDVLIKCEEIVFDYLVAKNTITH